MSRKYLNRYQYFVNNTGNFTIVPGITIPIKGTDKYVQYIKGKDRMDKLSQQYYESPTFGWLIMQANPLAGGIEFEIPDKFILRIPYPLTTTLQDYKSAVDLYNLYYGQQ